MPIDRTDADERLARLELIIHEHQATKKRQLVQRTVKLLRQTEGSQPFPRLKESIERIH